MRGRTETRLGNMSGGLVAALCLLAVAIGPAFAGDIAHQPRTDDAVGEHVTGGRAPSVQAREDARDAGTEDCRDGCARIRRRSGPGDE